MTAVRDIDEAAEEPMTEVEERAAAVEAVAVSVAVEHEPDDGQEYDERIDLVRSGLVRIRFAGQRFRLRRPFFGELKTLRLALQDVNDEIAEASDEALRLARQMTEEAKADDVNELGLDEWSSWRRDARKRSNEASRTLTDLTETTRLRWWEQTWDLLAVDDRPDDWPSWVVDPTLHSALIAHWRSAPLGRG